MAPAASFVSRKTPEMMRFLSFWFHWLAHKSDERVKRKRHATEVDVALWRRRGRE